MTLVEVVAALGMIGLLVSLLLPAVEQAREAARRASCASKLHQILLSVHNYQSAFGVFPPTIEPTEFRHLRLKAGGPASPVLKQFSIFTHLLPYLEQSSLFHAINFSVGVDDPYLFDETTYRRGFEANRTVMSTRLGAFLCPSDGGNGDPGWTGGTNYRVNLGTEPAIYSTDGPIMDGTQQLTPAAIRDGMSQTAAFSEKLRGRVAGVAVEPRTDMVVGGLRSSFAPEELLGSCRPVSNPPAFYSSAGLTWFVGSLSQTSYNHVIGPNSTAPDCILPLSDPISGLIGARSNHQVVHVARCDGSVRGIAGTIHPAVWHALGTRAGGEIIPGE